MGSRVQSTVGRFPELCFLQFHVAQLGGQYTTLFFPLGSMLMILIIIIMRATFHISHFKLCIALLLLLLLLLLKKVGSVRLREIDIHPISPKTPAPQYQPIDRKKRNGKRVEDYSRDSAA